MDFQKYRDLVFEYIKKPIITGVLGLIVGLIIGLPILGWWIMPVKWKDAGPQHLRQDIQEDYMSMMVDSYAHNGDPQLALTRWNEFGETGAQVLQTVQADPFMNPNEVAEFSGLVGVTYNGTGSLPAEGAIEPEESDGGVTSAPEAAAISEPEEETKSKMNPILLLGVLCLTLLLIGGALVYVLVIRKKPGSILPGRGDTGNVDVMGEPVEYVDQGEETPIAQFMTTYMLGDDLYDDSFSIDSPTGEFLGECGVGISETIGVGDPKKVTAYEVWLFDKNDIQTITKVLMSEHAYNDEAIKERLQSKGEPILMEPGKHIILETATLQLEARLIEMNFGQGALPDNSFVDRMTLELAVWPKIVEAN